jgi:uncharacterized protein (TIGR03790 family)
MKNVFISLLIFCFCYPQEDPNPLPVYPINNFDPTYENIAKPEEVLVIYRNPRNVSDTMSVYIKNHYIDKRNIPFINTKGLDLPLVDVIDNHQINLIFQGEMIHDQDWVFPNTNHAWRYFLLHVFDPIQNYLATTYVNGQQLKNTIKYIVLCKGIPLKINPYVEFSGNDYYTRQMVTVDGMLCLLSQTNSNFSLLNNVFGTDYSSLGNPYFDADKNLDGTYRFKPRHFSYSNYEINYLVSRLDGLTYNDVINLIDISTQPDLSGNNLFMLDAHYSSGLGVYALRNDAITTKNYLNSIGYNSFLDLTDDIYYSSLIPVIGYSSSGRHAGMPFNYNYLFTFDKANGSIYNTYESYNGFYMDTLNLWNRQDNQGMLTEWIRVGGSGGAGHIYEPLSSTISKDSIFFPLYSIGYSLIDAAYQGIPYLAFRNVVIGDPLTTIAWGKQSLTSNLNWSGANLVTGEIDISDLKTLTIANNSVINLRHQGFITGEGKLILGQNVTFNLYSWDKGLFLSYDSDNPRLVWGAHPTLGLGANYRVYRKLGANASWDLITTTTAKEYRDLQMQFSEIGDQLDNLFYKVVAFSELPGIYESNTVSCLGDKSPKKIIANQNLTTPVEYSLEQNYPNPFNPNTQIKYSIKETGLVQLKVYDILGKVVATLVNENKEARFYSIEFDAFNLPSGVYIYQLTTPDFTQARKMILTK